MKVRQPSKKGIPREPLTDLHSGRTGWSLGNFPLFAGGRSLAFPIPVWSPGTQSVRWESVNRNPSCVVQSFFSPFVQYILFPLILHSVYVPNFPWLCDKNPVFFYNIFGIQTWGLRKGEYYANQKIFFPFTSKPLFPWTSSEGRGNCAPQRLQVPIGWTSEWCLSHSPPGQGWDAWRGSLPLPWPRGPTVLGSS